MKITLVFPAIGRRKGSSYLRLWQMEPLSMGTLAALTPDDVEVKFYDDRIEPIPYDEPTDLVAMTVETYTARRAYQIASEFRKRKVPVVMGGFHPTLRPDEVASHAEAVVCGGAENLWQRVIDDFRHGRWQKFYRDTQPLVLGSLMPRRDIFRGKKYLPLGLIEAGRGCVHSCEFCSIQCMHGGEYGRRPLDAIVAELQDLRRSRRLFFFVDDNVTAKPAEAREFLRAIEPLGIRWLSQMSVTAAHDEGFVDLLARSGCQGVLIGFESLDRENLTAMHKDFNTQAGDYERAIANLRRRGIGVFGTFVFGYDNDGPETFAETLGFAREQGLYLGAFNHLVPFPGTPVHRRLEEAGRLQNPEWWLDPDYRFNDVAFQPARMSAEELQAECMAARQAFYSIASIRQRYRVLRRQLGVSGRFFYWLMNLMHRGEVGRRNGFPLGDESWQGEWIEAQ
jgi:radical SAM superfamily enzyme YgiQ (UPF0313 family)